MVKFLTSFNYYFHPQSFFHGGCKFNFILRGEDPPIHLPVQVDRVLPLWQKNKWPSDPCNFSVYVKFRKLSRRKKNNSLKSIIKCVFHKKRKREEDLSFSIEYEAFSNQESNGIRQWPMNWCTSSMMMHKIISIFQFSKLLSQRI